MTTSNDRPPAQPGQEAERGDAPNDAVARITGTRENGTIDIEWLISLAAVRYLGLGAGSYLYTRPCDAVDRQGLTDAVRELFDAVQVFRNERALERCVALRATAGYARLCTAWEDVRDAITPAAATGGTTDAAKGGA